MLKFDDHRDKIVRHARKKPAAKAASREKFEKRLCQATDLLNLITLSIAIFRLVVLTSPSLTSAASVGDISNFSKPSLGWIQKIVVPARQISGPFAGPGRACELDLATMTRHDGTLTVSGIRPDGIMLIWTGGQTAPGNADCGSHAQILIPEANYTRLITAETPAYVR